MKVILASQSFIRREAMDMLSIPYEVIPSHFDESSVSAVDPRQRAQLLSEAKAQLVAQQHPNAVVIGSDAFMVRDGELFEKPVDLEDARRMLRDLSGSSFEFLTGLAVYCHETEQMLSTVDSCRVTFRDIREEEIEKYVRTHPVLKCAGGFDVAGALMFAERIEGSPTITTGMPISRLMQYLREHEGCQMALQPHEPG